MKIKTKKNMYIGELLEYVRKDDLRGRYFRVVNESRYIKVTPDGDIYFDADFRFKPDDTFTVEVEEELTEGTELCGVTTFIKKPRGIFPVYAASASIGECLNSLNDDDIEPLKIFNGVTEIWSKEHGIPESGVLEVSE